MLEAPQWATFVTTVWNVVAVAAVLTSILAVAVAIQSAFRIVGAIWAAMMMARADAEDEA